MRLSAIVITRNEIRNISDCIQALSFADEIIVLDNASTDGTPDAARRLGAQVFETEDWPGFGMQKNRALELANGEWVLSIDADERVSPSLAREITEVIEQSRMLNQRVVFAIPRLTQFCGVWIKHCGWTPDYVVRLFKRGEARFSNDLVHEKVIMSQSDTKIVRLQHPLLHFSYRTPASYWEKLQRYSHDWAIDQQTKGRKTSILRAALSGAAAFVRSYFFRLGFLDGAMGFVVCVLQAQAAFGKYFELYWLNQQDEN